MEKLRSDCGMEHGRDARVAPGVSAYVPETGDDEVLPDAPRFEEAPKDSLSSPPAPALFSVEPVPLTRYCPHVTKEACMEARGAQRCCEDVHFRRIKHPQTAREPNADCHFLQLCRFSTTTCRFQHWEIDDVLAAAGRRPTAPPLRFCAAAAARVPERLRAIPEPQWICADLSPAGLDLATLGEFGVVMMDPPVRQHPFNVRHNSNHRLLGSVTTLADPHPLDTLKWAIGIDVPYDTLTDSQLRELNVASLQTDGYLLLWVTGRAMELGRRLLTAWGYARESELCWIKLNLMQNLVRTGRTGHFLNHSKEHCLIGVKGDPPLGAPGVRRDCDVLVSELRESSRKPEEIYGVAQRLWPGARCLELFARQHNVGKPGWVAVGNQLDGVRVVDPALRRRLSERYPRVEFT